MLLWLQQDIQMISEMLSPLQWQMNLYTQRVLWSTLPGTRITHSLFRTYPPAAAVTTKQLKGRYTCHPTSPAWTPPGVMSLIPALQTKRNSLPSLAIDTPLPTVTKTAVLTGTHRTATLSSVHHSPPTVKTIWTPLVHAYGNQNRDANRYPSYRYSIQRASFTTSGQNDLNTTCTCTRISVSSVLGMFRLSCSSYDMQNWV